MTLNFELLNAILTMVNTSSFDITAIGCLGSEDEEGRDVSLSSSLWVGSSSASIFPKNQEMTTSVHMKGG